MMDLIKAQRWQPRKSTYKGNANQEIQKQTLFCALRLNMRRPKSSTDVRKSGLPALLSAFQ